MMVAARELWALIPLAELWRDHRLRTIVLRLILLRTIGLGKIGRGAPILIWFGLADACALSGGNPDGT